MKQLLSVTFVLMSFGTSSYQANATITAPAVVAQSQVSHTILSTTTESYTVSIDPVSYKVNAYELQISYDPTRHEVLSVVPASSACEDRFVISRKIDQQAGTIYLACGTITPPPVGQPVPLASIVFKRSATETLPLIAVDTTSSAVYQHDGQGTRVPIMAPVAS